MNIGAWNNWIIWIILTLGLISYQLIVYRILCTRKQEELLATEEWLETLSTLISALPLLGLLGTITGLLQTFYTMSLGLSLDQSELLSSGIADALLTTQCGLAMAVPGWLLLAWLRNIHHKAMISHPELSHAS